jgi:1,2-diacylglycerol 3-alpha-glucosyltransferase
MKIAIFSDAFPPQVNGIVTHLTESVNMFLCRKHRLLFFAPKQPKIPKNFSLGKGIELYTLKSFPLMVYENWRITLPFSPFVLFKIKSFKPDVIHFHTPFTIGLNGIVAAKILKIPLVGTFHGYFMEPEYLRIANLDKFSLDKSPTINNLGWQYARLFYNRADVIVAPSQYTKLDLENHKFAPPIQTISNGISLSKINGHGVISHINRIFLPKNYFLYAGRISKEKSLDVLINAFSQFSKINQAVHLVLVGDGPAKNELKNLVSFHNLTSRIHFVGIVEHDILIKSNILRNAIAFVTTSKSETQAISALEALGFGLPLIGVKSRAVPELIDGNGILCGPDNIQQISQALHMIINNKTLRIEYSRRSLQIAKKHSIDITVGKLEALYEGLILKKSTKRCV